jgi:hypothetical protein
MISERVPGSERRRNPKSRREPAEKVVRDIRRKTRRRFSAEEKIRIVIEGLRGEESIASLCRREGIASATLPPESASERWDQRTTPSLLNVAISGSA